MSERTACVVFLTAAGERSTIAAPVGNSLMQIARDNDLPIEGTCGGACACATCHVIVEDGWYDLLDDMTAEEDEMLELAFGVEPTSRLGCQIILTPALDGITVMIASEN